MYTLNVGVYFDNSHSQGCDPITFSHTVTVSHQQSHQNEEKGHKHWDNFNNINI